MQIQLAERYITERLRNELAETYFYHNLHHTEDVVKAAMRIAEEEGVTDKESLYILRTAALYHDCGFLDSAIHHEEAGCAIAMRHLPDFQYSEDQIRRITTLIMKTRVPQQPEDLLECILCDADLDHLGGDDFDDKSIRLFREWQVTGRVADESEFNKLQIAFLESHHYWTSSSRANRQPVKEEHLKRLKRIQKLPH